MTDDAKQQRTEAQIEHSRHAALTHGLTSEFAKTGNESALTEPQRDRLLGLRAQLTDVDGRIEALIDKAASLGLVVEWGQAWLKDKAEREGAVKAFESPMLARWFTAFESFRRAVESLHRMAAAGKGDGGPTAGDVLDAIRSKREQSE